jgi:hypothetical protein
MNFSNRSQLPDHISHVLRSAWLNDAYDFTPSDKAISVTTLIGPAQKRVLERRHKDDLSLDVLDTIPALLGQALHHILERAGQDAPTAIPEERLQTMFDGWAISGKSDLYETKDKILVDYKNSSVWAFIFGKKEWAEQLNVLRWIRERNGQTVNGLAIVLFCGDWRRNEALKNPDYPARVVNIPVPMWTMDEATAYVDARLKLHQAAQDGKTVPCSEEERWQKPTSWAVVKEGNKRASSVHSTEADAAGALKGGQHIEKRPGESVRCSGYCLAAPKCSQWAADPTNPKNAKENGSD